MAEEARKLSQLTVDEARDMALVDLAYDLLKKVNKPFYYRDLMQEVANLRGMTEEEIQSVIAILYTEINIDGRFLNIGNNTWGLKRWYPVDKTADKTTGGKKFIRKDDDFFDEDEDAELYLDEEHEVDEEELDLVDEEEDLEFDDVDPLEDEVEEIEEEAAEEDEELREEDEEDY